MAGHSISQGDLAKKLQLSGATVSLALADNPRIPPQTRMRVKTMAIKLGYKADLYATHLASKRWANEAPKCRPNIGYIQCLLDEGTTDRYLPGLFRQADALGYNLDVLKLPEFKNEDHLTKVLYNRGIQGVIVGQSASNFRPYIPALNKIAAVQCGLYLPVEVFTLVRSDLDAVVRLCFEKVRARNFRRIGMVLLNNPRAESDQILENSMWNLKRIHPENIEIFVETWNSIKAQQAPLKKWFYRHKVDAVVGITSMVDDFLQQFEIEVPFASMIHEPDRPQYDATDLQSSVMGEMSINLLDSYLRQNLFGIPSVKKVFMVEPAWHEGTSLSRPRVTKNTQALPARL